MTKRLGFKKFFMHGADWGGLIARNIAILYPEE